MWYLNTFIILKTLLVSSFVNKVLILDLLSLNPYILSRKVCYNSGNIFEYKEDIKNEQHIYNAPFQC